MTYPQAVRAFLAAAGAGGSSHCRELRAMFERGHPVPDHKDVLSWSEVVSGALFVADQEDWQRGGDEYGVRQTVQVVVLPGSGDVVLQYETCRGNRVVMSRHGTGLGFGGWGVDFRFDPESETLAVRQAAAEAAADLPDWEVAEPVGLSERVERTAYFSS